GVNTDELYNIPGGTYSVIMTNTDNGCDDTLQFAITDNVGTAPAIDMATPEVDYDVDSVTVCSGTPDGSIQILEIDNSTDLSGYYFLWYSGSDTTTGTFIGGNAGVDSTSSITNQAAGQYTVIAIDSTSGCSSAQATFQIDEVLSTPTATQNAYGSGSEQNTVCNSELNIGAEYNGALEITPDYAATYTYEWHAVAKSAVVDGSTEANLIISGAAGVNTDSLYNIPGGTYSVIMTNTDNGCADTLQFAI
ncbi:MAG: hypothetical protein JXQ90_24125, partial [Cyclobacteriaceae bacterium]